MKAIPIIWLCVLMVAVSCRKRPVPLAHDWTPTVRITETKDSLVGGVVLHKWQNTIIALQGKDDMSATCFLMNSNDYSWSEVALTGVPRGYYWDWPAIDNDSDKICFKQDFLEDDHLGIDVIVGRLIANGRLIVTNVVEEKWKIDKEALLGKTPPNVGLTAPRKRIWPASGMEFIFNGPDLYVPYCIAGLEVTYRGKTLVTDGTKGPFGNGVLHSSDSGMTWQVEQISDRSAWDPKVYKSKNYYYYFSARMAVGGGGQLCFARKATDSGSWTDLNL